MNSSSGSNLSGLRGMAQREGKKVGVLVALVALMLLLWGRALSGNAGPARSSAAAVKSQAAPAAKSAPSTVAPAPRGNQDALREWMRGAISTPGRNIFAVKMEYFPRDGAATSSALTSVGFWDEVAKSLAVRADQEKRRQVLLENLRADARRLRLETIIMGSQPQAMINGGLVKAGDVVASFRVEKIEARRIVVEREGIRLEILMK